VFGKPVTPSLEPWQLLAEVSREPDLTQRWQRLRVMVDVDRFASFMALEILSNHRDGYCLAANNYRIYQDPDSARFIFLPHGMDQLFGRADLALEPHVSGPVAQGLLAIPEFRRLYWERAGLLFTNVLRPALPGLTREHPLTLQPSNGLSPDQIRSIRAAVAALQTQIAERLKFVARQLEQPPEKKLVRFTNNRASLDEGWKPVDTPAGGGMSRGTGPSGRLCLHIQAGPATSASWRTTRWLEPGRYRFGGEVFTQATRPLPNGRNNGARLRISGIRSQGTTSLDGDAPWTQLEAEFDVPAPGAEAEFVCELRASQGEAWFELSSLHLRKLAP
jgi:hypothetical protein